MQIVYIILWALLCVYCSYSAHKMSPVLYILGGFFLFMFGWYLVNYLAPFDLFAGTYGIIFRCIAAVFLVAVLIIYFFSKRNSSGQ
ncbi:MAG: hypothetical protein J1E96_01915 [Ruminococcus sp.]|nr:hypothetical protein [Ruminococcus sp.]